MLLTTDNDGVRTFSLKFVEAVVMCFTRRTQVWLYVTGILLSSFVSEVTLPTLGARIMAHMHFVLVHAVVCYAVSRRKYVSELCF